MTGASTRRMFLRRAAGAAAATATAAAGLRAAPFARGADGDAAAIPRAPAERPNLVIFIADDLGWGDVGYHGSEGRTPTIDRLAAEGVELDRYYSFPVCSPARAALLTGRSPMRLGVGGPIEAGERGLPLNEHLLPQTLQAAGYQTWLLGKWHLGGEQDGAYLPFHRGFDYFYGYAGGSIDPYTHLSYPERQRDWQVNGRPLYEEGYCEDLLTAAAGRLLRGRDTARPFFLMFAFHAVHQPLRAPDEFVERYLELPDKRRRLLLAMAETMDAAIGRVLAVIEEEGAGKDTLVVFCSDNGADEEDGGGSNAPLRSAKDTIWEGGIRVPAVVWWPGVLPAGVKRRQLVTPMDWFPTLTAALGVAPQNVKPFDGHDRWAAIRDGTVTPPQGLVIAHEGDAAVYDGEWKLVRTKQNGRTFLFRIEEDPGEQHDLAAQFPEVARALSNRIPPATNSPPGGSRD